MGFLSTREKNSLSPPFPFVVISTNGIFLEALAFKDIYRTKRR